MPHAVVSERQRSRAKQLRRTMTRAETLLWRHLKANRMDGVGFRQKADQRRDAFFESEGFQVLRFTNEQVMSNLEGVVETIRQAISAGARGSPPSLPLPHKGGGNGETDQSNLVNNDQTRGKQP
jgi:very-short-patch-repair endonuclease